MSLIGIRINKIIDPFGNRILIQACILTGIAGMLGTILNIILKLEFINTVLTVGIVVFSFFNLWLIRRYKAYILVRAFMTLFLLLIVNAAWYYNYSSYGPMLSLFILIGILVIFIWPMKSAIYISILLILNVGFLFIMDLEYHENFAKYVDDITRISDIYFGTLIAVIIVLFFSYTAKANYIKKYKEAKKSDEMKTLFLQNMSHELRTPLNAIIGFSELIDENSDIKEVVAYNKIINSGGNHLLSIVNDLLDITLIESGEIKVIKEDINLNKLMKEIQTLMEFEKKNLNKDNLDLVLEIPSEVADFTIFSDCAKLKQLLINLLKNALKFTDEGRVTYGYTIESENDKSCLEFFVSDTGIGINDESKVKIFDSFWQENQSKTKLYGGTGVGLAISKKLAELLDGELLLESKVGQGSIFYFKLPHITHKV